MAIQDLLEVIPAPANRLQASDAAGRSAVERQLGANLPSDYWDFVDRYGPGILSDFIVIYTPLDQSEYGNVLAAVPRVCDIQRQLKRSAGARFLYNIYPNSPGLMPWGHDQNGNGYYWLTEGEPDKWPVLVGAGRDSRWQRFDLSMTSFLAMALKGEINCDIWPTDFPNPLKAKHFRFQPDGE